jgi:hypothetical protein
MIESTKKLQNRPLGNLAMSKMTSQILESFDALPPREQHEVLAEMLRRVGELPEDFLTDEQLTGLADELFQSLDAEEANERESDAR